ncbi:MAG: hypothetical protein K2X03_20550 [Bryobacteraceae bacterium]|nr:hypothetical protein [Bryobacteraceae bacterium]
MSLKDLPAVRVAEAGAAAVQACLLYLADQVDESTVQVEARGRLGVADRVLTEFRLTSAASGLRGRLQLNEEFGLEVTESSATVRLRVATGPE